MSQSPGPHTPSCVPDQAVRDVPLTDPAAANHAAVEAGSPSGRRAHKVDTLLKFYAALDRQSRGEDGVPRVRLTAAEFYDHYFYPNRPVILQGLMDTWPALSRWTFGWLREQFGDFDVEVHANRIANKNYERHFRGGRGTMRFREFAALLEDDVESNDVYLVARNYAFERAEFRRLLDDLGSPKGFLDPAHKNPNNVKLWIGPRGTVTPLHHDRDSVLLAQLRGRKMVKFIAPFHLASVYNDPETCYSDVPLDGPVDYDRFPLMRNVPIVETVVHPGELVFIPAAWWHWVRALDASISVGFKNFVFRGERLAWRYR